ncbi:formaldehyde dehydrogenase AdhA [Phytophthora nicotianae]|uniref:Formaldehyde dehydrogenase AdhA n=1 Tax=Phytophthora nicotianae TaxID=4792 RepID=A0A0W8D7F9_PHYNI|nr:formaldehyde dehydrogenase AdhA [Phytophthora nicotianae]
MLHLWQPSSGIDSRARARVDPRPVASEASSSVIGNRRSRSHCSRTIRCCASKCCDFKICGTCVRNSRSRRPTRPPDHRHELCHGIFQPVPYRTECPRSPANVLSSDKQRSFLNAMIEPHTTLGGKPAANRILSVWESYSNFHSSVKLSCDSTELITADNCSSVVVHGTLHLRYSRRTIENVYPHAVAEEDLIQMLIGRQLHVHYRAEMHFNSKGRLESYAMSPDFVGALMEILRSWRDCERILGRALIKGHVLGEEPEPEVDMEPVEIVSDAEIKSDVQETSSSSILHQIEETEEPARTTSRAMKLDYILS